MADSAARGYFDHSDVQKSNVSSALSMQKGVYFSFKAFNILVLFLLAPACVLLVSRR